MSLALRFAWRRLRRLHDLRHDDVLHRMHRLVPEDETALRVHLEQPGLHGLRRDHEQRLDLSRACVHDAVREDSEDLAVVRHHGLSLEFRREQLHRAPPTPGIRRSLFLGCPSRGDARPRTIRDTSTTSLPGQKKTFSAMSLSSYRPTWHRTIPRQTFLYRHPR